VNSSGTEKQIVGIYSNYSSKKLRKMTNYNDGKRRGKEESSFTTDDKMMMESLLTFVSLKAFVSHFFPRTPSIKFHEKLETLMLIERLTMFMSL
jgi:hypothetical protein